VTGPAAVGRPLAGPGEPAYGFAPTGSKTLERPRQAPAPARGRRQGCGATAVGRGAQGPLRRPRPCWRGRGGWGKPGGKPPKAPAAPAQGPFRSFEDEAAAIAAAMNEVERAERARAGRRRAAFYAHFVPWGAINPRQRAKLRWFSTLESGRPPRAGGQAAREIGMGFRNGSSRTRTGVVSSDRAAALRAPLRGAYRCRGRPMTRGFSATLVVP
jgi:hypothetical protein